MEEFFDLRVRGVRSARSYPRARSLHLETADGVVVVFKRRALSQLARAAGVSVPELLALPPERLQATVSNVLTSRIVRVWRIPDSDVLYAVRVTSEEYIAVPHRILFGAVERIVGRPPARIKKYPVRTVGFWLLVADTSGSAPFRAYLAVSNANTGQHSVKVYAWYEYGRGGWLDTRAGGTVRLAHRARDQDALMRRIEAVVRGQAKRIVGSAARVRQQVDQLESVRVNWETLSRFLAVVQPYVPKYAERRLRGRLLGEARERGPTARVVFDAVTSVIPSIEGYESMVRLSRLATRILEEPLSLLRIIEEEEEG